MIFGLVSFPISLLILATIQPIRFLPDEAQIACRAILPQCFTRHGWRQLCRRDPMVVEAHPEACHQAGHGTRH
ncbi:MAG: hypothetical protein CL862_14610 [Cyanobium sp. NAT70]|nr:hypothetical protein [Cyanobium sp. NAT70]